MDKLLNNSDESFLRWRISTEEEKSMIEEEECDGEPLLRTVVRTNYLYHLRQSLRKNLEAMKQTNEGVEENNINKVIKGCSALLEEKALRNCMIAKLYQRMMTQTIKDVKKATSEGTIYSPLKEFAEHQGRTSSSCAPSNKEVQTDIRMDFFNDVLNDVPKQAQPPPAPRKPSFINTEPIASVKSDFKMVNGVQRTWCVKCSKETLGRCLHSQQTNSNTLSHSHLTTNTNGVDDKPGSWLDWSQPQKTESIDEDHKIDMNERQANFNNKAADKNEDFQEKLKSQNFVEAVAYWFYVESEINDLPAKKRKKLDEHFTRLFGKDHNIDYYFLTDEQKSIACRKRIARYVVIELTNYFNKKKIASKDVFKTLAKHITSLLLGRSLYPTPEEIRNSVEEFFHDGRMIRNEDDFYI